MKTAPIIAFVSIAGCAPAPTAHVQSNSVMYNAPVVNIYEMRLSDGTRCVYLGSSNAITCEWQRPVVLVPRVE